jgi:CO dehydrogenase/acetyl-CoA synthase epsilon subunit
MEGSDLGGAEDGNAVGAVDIRLYAAARPVVSRMLHRAAESVVVAGGLILREWCEKIFKVWRE